MTAPANVWPQDRLEKLWALQKLALKAGNRVIVKDHLINVTKGGEQRTFDSIDDAAAWHGGAK